MSMECFERADALHAHEAKIRAIAVTDADSLCEYLKGFWEFIYNHKMFGCIYDIYADGVLLHRENGMLLHDIPEVEHDVMKICAAFPDLKVEIRDIFAVKTSETSYKVWMRYYFTGTNTGYSVYGAPTNLKMEPNKAYIIPSRISTEAAVDFLAAVRDFAGDGCFVHDEFATVMASLSGELRTMREAVEAADAAWAQEVDGEQGDGSGPPYVPGDYEVRPVDEDGEEPDDEPEPVEIPEPDDRDLYFTLKAMYGDSGEPGITGTRTPFPDWDHISDWTATDWLKLQTYKDKVLAAAESGFMGISSVAGILAAAKGAMIRVPLPRQVELCMWATEVVDRLMFGLEDDLQEMCAGSLHSHEGRLVQKQLVSAANGHAQDSPD